MTKARSRQAKRSEPAASKRSPSSAPLALRKVEAGDQANAGDASTKPDGGLPSAILAVPPSEAVRAAENTVAPRTERPELTASASTPEAASTPVSTPGPSPDSSVGATEASGASRSTGDGPGARGSSRSGVPPTGPDAIRAAVERARAAQSAWARKPFDERTGALERAAKSMLLRRREAMAIVREEMGKGDVEGLFNEALGPLDAVKGWTAVVKEALGRKSVRLNPLAFPKKSATVELLPRGVVGVIAPWNFPIAGLYRSLFPALLTGNGVVVKPSEYTPKSTAWLVAELAKELPDGLVSVVQGEGAVGELLIDAGIDACVFTGSVSTGKKVRVRCAERGIPSSIEMGGKDGAIVLADCDLPRTLAGITQWALNNVGQACGAIEIAYVDERIADTFAERITGAWQRLRVEPGGPGEVDVAPLANERQLAIVEAHVADAVAKGGRVLTGGNRTGTGLGYAPTVIDRCTAAMDVVREETFGPVLAIVRVSGVDEAIRQINASSYGLGASIWTSDVSRAERLAERLDVGVVTINNHAFTGAIAALPWTGTRDTGFGIANSSYSLLTFTRPKAVVVDRSSAPEAFWLPFDQKLLDLGDILADAQLGKVGRALQIPLLLRRRMKKVRRFFGGE